MFANPFIFFEIFFDGFIVIYDALLYNIEYTGSGPIVTSFAQGVKKTGLKSAAFCCRGLSFPALPIIKGNGKGRGPIPPGGHRGSPAGKTSVEK